MTIESGTADITGFGANTSNNGDGQTSDRPDVTRATVDASRGTNGGSQGMSACEGAHSHHHDDISEVVPLDLDNEPVPGFEESASDCLNRALSIARNLNHAVLSSDHLMLALTLDSGGRRLLERVGDVTQLRDTAMKRLGAMHARYSSGEPAQTADLADLRQAAREAAAEREQLVAISDLVNAFPKADGRLTYASGGDAKARALIDKIENGLIPRVGEAVQTVGQAVQRIEDEIQNAVQTQTMTVQRLLADLSSKRSWDEEQQRQFIDDIRRQVREVADAQIGEAIRNFTEAVDAKLAELRVQHPTPDPNPPVATPATPAPKPRGYWSRIGTLL
jgi:hypothetical protein